METAIEDQDDHEDQEQIETHKQEDPTQIPEDSESQEESQIHNENLQSRFYRKDFPDENDIVIVSVPSSSGINHYDYRGILILHGIYRPKSPK